MQYDLSYTHSTTASNHLANPENLINRFLINRSPVKAIPCLSRMKKKYLHKLCARVKEKRSTQPAQILSLDQQRAVVYLGIRQTKYRLQALLGTHCSS
ncbi:hypothetical protein CDAR_504101 [Caerostris darwini]|uniref:Uncharacterized protein n=1 Tax=Caerostris darwini TaxID=1538125 RepID=A0AAV4RZA2_9ARAC|nr:hypothetical protein CDAR_504101 [Caerostris darwini]